MITRKTALLILLIHISLACKPLALPPLEDDHRDRDTTAELTQIIVPSYQFTCHGMVTSWSACVEPGGGSERYEIHFQVWRRQLTVTDSCYTLVGSNIPSDLLEPEGHCVHYKVPTGDEITVAPGDVMGFYVNRFKMGRTRITDPSGGGIQLDHEWTRSVEFLSVPLSPANTAIVGTQLCSGQGDMVLLDSAPVLAATITPIIQPSTTSTTNAATPLTTEVPPEEPRTTSETLTMATVISPNQPPPSTYSVSHTNVDTLHNMATTVRAADVSANQHIPLQSTSTRTATTTSSSSVMSSPDDFGEVRVENGGVPLLLLIGVVLCGVLVAFIILLVICVAAVWHKRLRRKPPQKDKVVRHGDSDMEYCEAYVQNSSSKHAPNVPMEWNRAYRTCTTLDPGNETVTGTPDDPGYSVPHKIQPQLPHKIRQPHTTEETARYSVVSMYDIVAQNHNRQSNDYEDIITTRN